jgi:hypothetical protein
MSDHCVGRFFVRSYESVTRTETSDTTLKNVTLGFIPDNYITLGTSPDATKRGLPLLFKKRVGERFKKILPKIIYMLYL